MTSKRIVAVYSILLSLSLIVAGLCLIVACTDIYRGVYQVGDYRFSPQAVAAAFRTIEIPVSVCLILILGGILFDIFLPTEKEKKPIEKQYAVILRQQWKKLDLSKCPSPLQKAILKEENTRKLHGVITLDLLLIGSVVFLIYAINGKHFHNVEINSSMIQAMKLFIPCLLVPFGYGIFTAYYCKASIRREIDLVKQALADGCTRPAAQTVSPAPASQSWTVYVKAAIVVIALALMLFGGLNGGTRDVLGKAVNICTECVGLG